MKKILKTALITSLIMLAALGALSFFLFKKGKEYKAGTQEKAMMQLDMLYSGYIKEQVDPDAAVPITEEGENANLRTIKYNSTSEIYRLDKSSETREKLDRWKKTGIRSIDEPLFVWNPYGTNQLSMYVYFETPEPYYVEYTVCVEDETIPDFTRTAYLDSAEKTSKEHEYQFVGFVPGRTNFIIMRFFDQKNQMSMKRTFKIDVPELKSQPSVRIKVKSGSSKEKMTNGLFFAVEKGKDSQILIYDNSGIIRGLIPLMPGTSSDVFVKSDGMYLEYENGRIAKISKMGQVANTFDVGGYNVDGGFVYNGYGQIWMLAEKKGSKTGNDLLLSINLNSGKVSQLADFKELLPGLYKKSRKNNWLGLNSIVMTGSSSVLVSSEITSSLFHVIGLSGGKTSVNYIIGDKAIFDDTPAGGMNFDKGLGGDEAKENKNEESKIELGTDFVPPYGISGISYVSGDYTEGPYEVAVFNSNYLDTSGIKKYAPGVKALKNEKKSYYYLLKIWPDDKKYTLTDSFEVPRSIKGGSTDVYSGHEIILSRDEHQYGEYDPTGRVLFKYTYGKKKNITKVRKESMKDFWFKSI